METFETDVREFIVSTLPINPQHKAAMLAESTSSLLIHYLNWLSRHIEPRPRKVHESAALLSNPALGDPVLGPGYKIIRQAIERGEVLTPFLSERVSYGYEPPQVGSKKKLTRRKDLDMLLNDWGVHHLHLSTKLRPNGLVMRTGPLLLTSMKPNDAYLIDIKHHGNWACDSTVRTMIDEWPDAGIVYEIPGLLPGTDPTPEERRTLRNAGIGSSIAHNGKVYMAGFGYSTAGTTVEAAIRSSVIWRNLRAFAERATSDPTYIRREMAQKGVISDAPLDLHFEVFANGRYGITDRSSGFAFLFT